MPATATKTDTKLVYEIIRRSGVPAGDRRALREELILKLGEDGGRESLVELLRFLRSEGRRHRRGERAKRENETSFTDRDAHGLDIPGVDGHRAEDGDE